MKKALLVILLSFTSYTPFAFAQPYIAMSIASVATTVAGPVRDEKRTDTAFKVAGGYRTGDWAAELATTIDPGADRFATLSALRWIGPVYVKAGAAYLNGEQAVQDTGPVPPVPPGGRPAVESERARTWSGVTWVAGAGAEIPLYKNGALRLDVERTGHVGELRYATQLSAGLAIHF